MIRKHHSGESCGNSKTQEDPVFRFPLRDSEPTKTANCFTSWFHEVRAPTVLNARERVATWAVAVEKAKRGKRKLKSRGQAPEP